MKYGSLDKLILFILPLILSVSAAFFLVYGDNDLLESDTEAHLEEVIHTNFVLPHVAEHPIKEERHDT